MAVKTAKSITYMWNISKIWAEQQAAGTRKWADGTEDAQLRTEIEELIKGASDGASSPQKVVDNQHRAASLAKHLCEQTRNAVDQLRELRYELEDLLSLTSDSKEASADHTAVVSSLLQLHVMCGRASDNSREAVREGLWTHLTDDEAYHSYRRLQDPSLIGVHSPATSSLRSWMQLHDAAVRHCLEARRQLDAESVSIRSLVASAASISSSRDADAQSRFNVLAAIISVGLGLPALVLTLYGATILLPLNTVPRLIAFAPVAVSLVLAAIIALWQGRRRGRIWTTIAVGIFLVLFLLLIAAGLLAPT